MPVCIRVMASCWEREREEREREKEEGEGEGEEEGAASPPRAASVSQNVNKISRNELVCPDHQWQHEETLN